LFLHKVISSEHAKTMPSFLAMFLGSNNTPKGLAVANVIWCGICEPQPEPIGMPNCGNPDQAGRSIMSNILTGCQHQLDIKKRENGITPLELRDLPPNLRQIMRLMLREIVMKLGPARSGCGAMPLKTGA